MANYKVVDADQLDADLKTVADAIREGSGVEGELPFPDGMAAAAIQSGGEDTHIKDFLEGTLTEIYDVNATKVRSYAFYVDNSLQKVNLPNANSIGNYSFYTCSKLAELYMPKVTTIGQYGLTGSALKDISFPYVKTIAKDGISSNYSLESLELPSLETANSNALEFNNKLKYISLPSLKTIGNYAIKACYELETVDIGELFNDGISTQCFSGCFELRTVVIRRTNAISALDNIDAFQNCYHYHGTVNATYNPDGLKDGYIYVPRALIEDYKVATNWVTFADQFRALEDYTVDGTTTGEMDWDKINGGAV